MSSVKRVDPIRSALDRLRHPLGGRGGSNVLLSEAADEWLTLLEALEQQRTDRVRAVALTSFVGESAASLDAGGDDLTDDVAERVRSWLDLFRTRGIAAVHEALRGREPARRGCCRDRTASGCSPTSTTSVSCSTRALTASGSASRRCSSGSARNAATLSRRPRGRAVSTPMPRPCRY